VPGRSFAGLRVIVHYAIQGVVALLALAPGDGKLVSVSADALRSRVKPSVQVGKHSGGRATRDARARSGRAAQTGGLITGAGLNSGELVEQALALIASAAKIGNERGVFCMGGIGGSFQQLFTSRLVGALHFHSAVGLSEIVRALLGQLGARVSVRYPLALQTPGKPAGYKNQERDGSKQ
jgi:hypothetical protein